MPEDMDQQSTMRPLPGWLVPAILVAGVLLLVTSIAIMVGGESPELRRARTPDPGLVGYRIPDFALIDQDGNPVDASIFDDRYTILDFIFTNCPFVCPGMNAQMARLQDELQGTGVRFVSISVDPEHDTPERLREYAQQLGADPRRWRFLTGTKNATWAIARDALSFDVSPDPSRMIPTKRGGQMVNINHPSKLILVGPDRQILGMYSYAFEPDIQAIMQRVRLLTDG